MVLFAMIHLYAYDIGRYKIRHAVGAESQYVGPSHYYGGLLAIKAIGAAVNPIDMVRDLITAVGFVIGKTPVQKRNHRVAMEPMGSDQYIQSYDTMPPSYSHQHPATQQPGQYVDIRQQTVHGSENQPVYAGRYDPLAGHRY